MIRFTLSLIAVGFGTFAIYRLVKAVDPESSGLLCLIPFVNLYPAARKLAGSSFWPAFYVASFPFLVFLYYLFPDPHGSAGASSAELLVRFFATLFTFGFMVVRMVLGILALYTIFIMLCILIQAARSILSSRLHQVGAVVTGVLLTPYLGFLYIYCFAYKIKLNPPPGSEKQYTLIESFNPQNWTAVGYAWAAIGVSGLVLGLMFPPLIMLSVSLLFFAPIIAYFQYPNMVDRASVQGLVCILSLIVTIPLGALLYGTAAGFSESQTAKTPTKKENSVAYHMSKSMGEKLKKEQKKQADERKTKTAKNRL